MSDTVNETVSAIGDDGLADLAPSDDTDTVLPWYQSALNLAVLTFTIAVLAAGVGYVVGNNGAIDDPNTVDVGFLQDMRYHHEQAIEMALLYLDDPDTDGDLRTNRARSWSDSSWRWVG